MADSSNRYVCANCKRRKKKCDKALPMCTQCVELGAECLYPHTSQRTPEELRDIHSRLRRLENLLSQRMLHDHQHKDSGSSGLPLTEPQLQFPVSSANYIEICKVEAHLDETLASILEREDAELSVKDIYTTYFKHISPWLPVISKKRFLERLNCSWPKARQPEATLLVICMYLLQQGPHTRSGPREIRAHYQAAHWAFLMLQADSIGSVELAQNGLLLATYEHASGLLEQAYATIWTCVRMAYSLRLQDTIHRKKNGNEDDKLECAEIHSLWWGILIRERSSDFAWNKIHYARRLLASQHPSMEDYLPVNIEAWEASSSTIPLLGLRVVDSDLEHPSSDSFCREAQACCMLGQVLDLRRNGLTPSQSQPIAARLQIFLNRLLEPAFGAWGTWCGASSFAICALYDIFSTPDPSMAARDTSEKPPLSEGAEMALATITNIVVDIADAFDEQFPSFNMAAVSPSYSFLFYRAAIQLLSSMDKESSKARHDFNLLRKGCWYFSHRWPVANLYLEVIEASARSSGIHLPDLGEFVQPEGYLPGLC